MGKHKILLVDDNPISLKLLLAVFEGEDYEIATATDGLEALEVLLQDKIDLAITDVLMPNMDGYHLCYRIRVNAQLREIPVVIYTATYVSLSEEKIAMDMGASYYIRKPAPSQVLLSIAIEILAHPEKFPHKIPTRPESAEMMEQYSTKLIAKLEQSNIDLEVAKNKIQQSEKYFRALVENEYSMTIVMNAKLKVIYRSQSSETILGWSLEERERMSGEDITHPEDREYQRMLMKQSIDNPGKLIRLNLRVRHKNGNYLWLEGVSINKLSDPNVAGIVTNLHDVTETKWAEEQLAKTTDRLKEAQSIAHLGNWEVDLSNNTASWSDEIYSIYGYSKGEVPPTTETFLALMHPEDLSQAKKKVELAFTNAASASFDFRFIRKDKEVRYGYTEWRFEFDNTGKPSRLYGITQDITEKKLADEAFRETHERLLFHIENTPLGFIEWDGQFNLKICSRRAEEIFGWTVEEFKASGRTGFTQVYQEDLPWVSKVAEKFINGEIERNHIQHRNVTKDGRVIWCDWFNSVQKDKDGKVVAIMSLVQDITEKKEAEEKLAASEQRFRSLIENSSDAIVMNDEHSNIVYQSPSVTRILGYSIQERMGKRSLDYVHPDDQETTAWLYKNSAANPGVPIPFQHRFRHCDGQYRWLEGVLTNLSQDPNVKAYIANYRDVTARKEAEQILARTLRRFEQAQQIAHLGHWELDFATQRATWSDEAFRIYGIEPHSIGPSEDIFLQHVHPDDLEMVKAATEHGQQTLTPFSFYHRIVQPSGKVRKLFAVGQFEFDASNRPVALYGISLDITELAEKEIKLEQANKELATFIYKAYHDLRSPIVSMLGTVDLAHHDVKDQQALEYFGMISQIAQKQNKMLSDLIKVMSIRDRDLAIAPVEIEKLVGEVMESLKTVEGFDISQLKINNGVRERALTDRDLVFEILSNLSENSIHYRDPARPAEIRITTEPDKEGNLVLEVADNGIGIPEAVKDKVFDMFYRGTAVSKGTGLGLYIVKNAVEKLRGTIQLSSSERVGTTFRIKLPPAEK